MLDAHASAKVVVVVVDQSLAALELIEATLSGAGHRVLTTARTGASPSVPTSPA
jgi:hypothetical protein